MAGHMFLQPKQSKPCVRNKGHDLFFFAVCHDHVYTLAAPNNIYDGTSICTVPSIEIHYFAKLCVLCSLLCAYAADTIGKTFELPCLFDKSSIG